MNTDETLKFKALSLKATLHNQFGSDLVDHIFEQNPEAAKKSMRNICAFISHELFAEVESVCNNLSLSKRQVVEMALIDFMKKVDSVMADVDPFEGIATDDNGHPIGKQVTDGE
jgi:nucleoside 2-deoxyribosyltransferase